MKYYLIGYPLGYSYSPIIHKEFINNINYTSMPLDEKQFEEFILAKNYNGLNITIPYKEKVIKYLDEVDEVAKLINAVNVVINDNGKLKGYNTDIEGVRLSLFKNNISLKDKIVMILGSGGSYKTISYLAKIMGAKKIIGVSRNTKEAFITYQEAKKITDVEILFNATPVGTYPHEQETPIDISNFNKLECVFDMIYNPYNTRLLIQARERKIKAINGLETLIYQAGVADELFFLKKIEFDKYDQVYQKIKKEVRSISLIGLPGSGKSTIGKILADKLGYTFIDTDAIIEKQENMSISEIFKTKGEEYFRNLEVSVIKKIYREKKLVISTGGGMIENDEIMNLLKFNSIIVYLNRMMAKHLYNGKRPLLKNEQDLERLKLKRTPLYSKNADIIISENEAYNVVERIIDRI